MSYYVAYVGEVIIKPEYRKDFGHLFRREYDRVKCEPLLEIANGIIDSSLGELAGISRWSHNDMLAEWEGRYDTYYNKNTGDFTYGVYISPEVDAFLTEILSEITEEVYVKETYKHEIIQNRKYYSSLGERVETHRSGRSGEVGMVQIKPEYREDFDLFFHGKYSYITTELFRDFIEKNWISFGFIEFCCWHHDNEKKEWSGKYETSYDDASGRFVYGVCYNKYHKGEMTEFFNYLLPEITETVISEDFWEEGMGEECDD